MLATDVVAACRYLLVFTVLLVNTASNLGVLAFEFLFPAGLAGWVRLGLNWILAAFFLGVWCFNGAMVQQFKMEIASKRSMQLQGAEYGSV